MEGFDFYLLLMAYWRDTNSIVCQIETKFRPRVIVISSFVKDALRGFFPGIQLRKGSVHVEIWSWYNSKSYSKNFREHSSLTFSMVLVDGQRFLSQNPPLLEWLNQ